MDEEISMNFLKTWPIDRSFDCIFYLHIFSNPLFDLVPFQHELCHCLACESGSMQWIRWSVWVAGHLEWEGIRTRIVPQGFLINNHPSFTASADSWFIQPNLVKVMQFCSVTSFTHFIDPHMAYCNRSDWIVALYFALKSTRRMMRSVVIDWSIG